ncbi:hypothetical protein [Aquirufa salirivi]|uniref:Uncharacterized protein n=1 Tax=Aquirufa salirivi TaxID=3104729 RepID=A0ABW8RXN1_9BACT
MKNLVLLVCICLGIFSCKNSTPDPLNESNFKIKAGYICGWGAGIDTLEIVNQTVRYVYYVPRNSLKPQLTKSRKLSDLEWAEIRNVVNWSQFKLLKYKTCNVCFDGCDEWIAIQNGDLSHQITFTKGLKIDTISPLQSKLAQLKTELAQ